MQIPPRAAYWHARRRHDIAAEVDVASLVGHNPWTGVAVAGVVFAQLGLAVLLQHASWALIVVASYLVGAVVAHALGVLIHECAHNLAAGTSAGNKALAILANVPLVLPGAIDFRNKHLLHHKRLGEGELRDFQTPLARGAAWVGTSSLRKVVWLLFGSLVFRRGHVEGTPVKADVWAMANVVAPVIVLCPLTLAFGGHTLVYLILSGLFAFGAHPLGMRGYGEHAASRDDQPTNSHYGLLNLVSFNVGHHVEHHDFPGVPWNRLPRLRRLAPAHYASLATIDSWVSLFGRFLFRASVRVGAYVRPPADQGSSLVPQYGPDEVPPQ